MVTTSKPTIHLTFLTLEEVPSLYLWSISQDIEASFLYQFTQNQHGNTNHRNFPRKSQVFSLGCQDLYPFEQLQIVAFLSQYMDAIHVDK